MILFYIVLSTLIISLGSLVGIFTLSLKEEFLSKILLKLVALSSGALLGGAFLHLMPEGIEKLPSKLFFGITLVTLIIYLLIEKLLHWRHCHAGPNCPAHSFGHMNLIGDAIHNFIDGLIIASAFIINIPLGITTAVAMALHEIPQEIGDFGVLLYAGFNKKKALILNFLVAQTVVLGGLVGWCLFAYVEDITKYLLPVASAGFIYIALSDILPELRKEKKMKNFIWSFIFMLLGIALLFLIKDSH